MNPNPKPWEFDLPTHIPLPAVGEPRWEGSEQDRVKIDGVTYFPQDVENEIDHHTTVVAQLIRVREYIARQKELARWDCAGERAYDAYQKIRNPFDGQWDVISRESRDKWVAVAKAVIAGEG